MSLALETSQADQHALSICTQLATSLIMQGPSETSAGDALFQIHRYSGFAALTFALLFWLPSYSANAEQRLAHCFPGFLPSGERLSSRICPI